MITNLNKRVSNARRGGSVSFLCGVALFLLFPALSVDGREVLDAERRDDPQISAHIDKVLTAASEGNYDLAHHLLEEAEKRYPDNERLRNLRASIAEIKKLEISVDKEQKVTREGVHPPTEFAIPGVRRHPTEKERQKALETYNARGGLVWATGTSGIDNSEAPPGTRWFLGGITATGDLSFPFLQRFFGIESSVTFFPLYFPGRKSSEDVLGITHPLGDISLLLKLHVFFFQESQKTIKLEMAAGGLFSFLMVAPEIQSTQGAQATFGRTQRALTRVNVPIRLLATAPLLAFLGSSEFSRNLIFGGALMTHISLYPIEELRNIHYLFSVSLRYQFPRMLVELSYTQENNKGLDPISAHGVRLEVGLRG